MTSSTGCSGLTLRGSPPSRTIPSRMAARSTTAGTPVKSWSSTRAGVNAISFCAFEVTSQRQAPGCLQDRRTAHPRAEAGSRAGSSARTAIVQSRETRPSRARKAEEVADSPRLRSARCAYRTNCASPSFNHSPQRHVYSRPAVGRSTRGHVADRFHAESRRAEARRDDL